MNSKSTSVAAIFATNLAAFSLLLRPFASTLATLQLSLVFYWTTVYVADPTARKISLLPVFAGLRCSPESMLLLIGSTAVLSVWTHITSLAFLTGPAFVMLRELWRFRKFKGRSVLW